MKEKRTMIDTLNKKQFKKTMTDIRSQEVALDSEAFLEFIQYQHGKSINSTKLSPARTLSAGSIHLKYRILKIDYK